MSAARVIPGSQVLPVLLTAQCLAQQVPWQTTQKCSIQVTQSALISSIKKNIDIYGKMRWIFH